MLDFDRTAACSDDVEAKASSSTSSPLPLNSPASVTELITLFDRDEHGACVP
jgi:hypothetical protein